MFFPRSLQIATLIALLCVCASCVGEETMRGHMRRTVFFLVFFRRETDSSCICAFVEEGGEYALIVQWLFCLACTIYYGSLMNNTWKISLKILFKHEKDPARL